MAGSGDTAKPPKRVPKFDKRRREYRDYLTAYRRLVEKRGGPGAMTPEALLLCAQVAEAASLRRGVWTEHFSDPATMTAERAGSLRAQWTEAATAVRHGISTLRELDPIGGGGADLVGVLERARKRVLDAEAAARKPPPALLAAPTGSLSTMPPEGRHDD